ncbi:CLASP N-terminal domain protein [Kalmanozyma brasiliensis GHG001]|uniref:CLASP N-terminal domain-containing protein n=1 Tax=Kalmanozyma brasiliensis (strain GHG001) TaxID=1365824 RepID=V5ES74_KALBG|nr:CLASP N-terminal domain protein [Kalmanozyma brasiliensis GHG001]EST05788.1 CLASP N-terminal domain protein [Kalmanozyma brasiliensis GHG001]
MPLPSKALSADAKISIASVSDLHSHFDDLYDDLHAPETEHTWQKIERALLHIQAITRGGAPKYNEFVALLKEAAGPINNALLSERTKLSGTAGDLLNSIAPRMAERFEPLVPVFVPTLLLICARTNKVAVKRAEKSLHFVIKHCAPPSVVSYLREAIKDKGQGLRAVAAGTLVLVLEHTEKDRLTRRVADIEACIKSGATDSNPEVRQTTKRLFELYVSIWPERVEQFTKPMTPTIRRYLSLPKTGALQVDIPPMTEAPIRSARPPASHTSRQDEVLMPMSHAPQSRAAPAYTFFPDLQKTAATSSATTSTARTQPGAGYSMNDAAYGKRGLFADQIAAARNARLARMPSFNFDDAAKSETVPAPTMKRQPSFDQLRPQGPVTSGAMFRVSRFDVVAGPSRQDSNDGSRPRSGHGSESASHRHADINANAPSFAAASGLHGKSALLAAYKQAFVGDIPAAKASSSSSRDRQHREKSDKPPKSEKRREKTVTVRFEPSPDSKDSDSDRLLANAERGADELRRSRSAPQIAVQADNSHKETDADAHIPAETARSKARNSPEHHADWVDSDDDEDRPNTPPERYLHAQTPRTGVKASRVPAQRVAAVPSAVKASAMRVAAATPSAKIAASRVANVSESVESSPMPKAHAAPRTPQAPSAKVEAEMKAVPESIAVEADQKQLEVQDKIEAETVKPAVVAQVTAMPKDKPAAVKKVASSTVQSNKQPGKAAPVKTAPSASLAAKARLEARAAKTTPTGPAAEGRKVVSKAVSTVAKPVVVKRPIVSSSAAAFKPVAKPAASSAVMAKSSRPAATVKPSTTATSTTVRSKPSVTAKSVITAPATAVAVKKADAPTITRSSTLTALTASTRSKIVPAAAIKKFQPKATSSLRPKSSIAASLTAKSKLVGAKAAASDREVAVKKASVALVKAVEKHRRASAAAAQVASVAPGLPVAAVEPVEQTEPVVADVITQPAVEPIVEEQVVAHHAEVVAEEAADILSDTKTEGKAIEQTTEPVTVDNIADAHEGQSGMDVTASSVQPDESVVEEAAMSLDQFDTCVSQEEVQPEEERETPAVDDLQDLQADHVEAVTLAPSVPATPIKTPATPTAGTPARVRTPLSSKDTNLPRQPTSARVTPSKSFTPNRATPSKSCSPIKAPTTRSTPIHSSPLRRNPLLVPVQFDPDSFESESESEDESEEVVQLHFGRAREEQAENKAKKQLVLGLDSSDDSMMESGEADETVLLEAAA